MKQLPLIFVLALSFDLTAQVHNLDEQRKIVFPDIPGYLTLKCDLHQHTVFSDGGVWPTIRVSEALRDNLDAIAVTEHIEHQPHQHDIPHPDRNRAFEIELEAAKGESLIVISGSEITRKMPLGHANAIFVHDVNKLMMDDSVAVFREAKQQGAFTFLNHPHWTGQKKDGVAVLNDVHHQLIKEGLLDGIEVVNDVTYSDEALQIALDNNLTILGTSDIHGLVDWEYRVPEGGHRPITLVFATEKSLAGIKEGLENRRTVAYFDNLLIGQEAYLKPLIRACVSVKEAKYQTRDRIILEVTLRNNSSAEFLLQNKTNLTFQTHANLVMIAPHSEATLEVRTMQKLANVSLKFSVINAIIAPSTHPDLELEVSIPDSIQAE
jgi:hypothetical protein